METHDDEVWQSRFLARIVCKGGLNGDAGEKPENDRMLPGEVQKTNHFVMESQPCSEPEASAGDRGAAPALCLYDISPRPATLFIMSISLIAGAKTKSDRIEPNGKACAQFSTDKDM